MFVICGSPPPGDLVTSVADQILSAFTDLLGWWGSVPNVISLSLPPGVRHAKFACLILSLPS
jgi:hypothetical protein